jgi:hypothetical protein
MMPFMISYFLRFRTALAMFYAYDYECMKSFSSYLCYDIRRVEEGRDLKLHGDEH